MTPRRERYQSTFFEIARRRIADGVELRIVRDILRGVAIRWGRSAGEADAAVDLAANTARRLDSIPDRIDDFWSVGAILDSIFYKDPIGTRQGSRTQGKESAIQSALKVRATNQGAEGS